MGRKKILYSKPFKDVFLNCKKILGYKEDKVVEFKKSKKVLYDGKMYLKKDFPNNGKQRRKLKKLNKKFDYLWKFYEDPSYYLYRKHYINKLELCNHILFWVALLASLVLTIVVYCNSIETNDLFNTIFLGGMFVFLLILYGLCVLTNVRKNKAMKHTLKKAKKEKDHIVLKIKKVLKKSPLYDENTSLDFLDEHIKTMHEVELLASKNDVPEEKVSEEVVSDDENNINVEEDKNRDVVTTTTFDEKVLETTEETSVNEEEKVESITLSSDSDKEVISTTTFNEELIPTEEEGVFNKVEDLKENEREESYEDVLPSEDIVEETPIEDVQEESVETETEEISFEEVSPEEEVNEVQDSNENELDETPIEVVQEEPIEIEAEETSSDEALSEESMEDKNNEESSLNEVAEDTTETNLNDVANVELDETQENETLEEQTFEEAIEIELKEEKE